MLRQDVFIYLNYSSCKIHGKFQQINIDYCRLRSIIIDYHYRIPPMANTVLLISKVFINVCRSYVKCL